MPRSVRARADVPAQSAVSVVEKAIALMDSVGTGRSGYGVSELARRTGLPKTTAHRLLGVLVQCEIVTKQGDRYRWGQRLHEIAGRLGPRPERLREHLLPYLADAYVLTRQTATIGVRSHSELAPVEVIDGRRLKLCATATGRSPLHCTAVGKVLLAYAPDAVRREVFAARLTAMTPATITSVGTLACELDRVRRRGLAVADGEYRIGVRSVAAPIFDARGAVVAALGIAGPADDFPVPAMAQAAMRVAQAASRALRKTEFAHTSHRDPVLARHTTLAT
jgi:DNA-binding IclR family transcriptional regulator